MTRFCLLLGLFVSATCVGDDLESQMRMEEKVFLQSRPAGVQHRQAEAVRAAMRGDSRELTAIREERNSPPALPEGVERRDLTTTLTLFAPSRPASRPRPVLLYLHGGGWAFGSINSCARFCAALALAGDVCVVAQNYRLAPENPYPAALDDCRAAFRYLREHAAEWGGDSSRISIGGDSAGGNLAFAAALAEPGVHSIVPIYPVTRLFTVETESWRTYGKGYGNDAELMEAFQEAYAGANGRDPLVSVECATDEALRGLPPTLVIAAGHDVLLDQGAAFVRRLLENSVTVDYHVFAGATHLFITVPGQPTAFAEAVRLTADFLNRDQRRRCVKDNDLNQKRKDDAK